MATKNYWHDEHPDYPVRDWQTEVANGDTRRGYWEFVDMNVTGDETDQGCQEIEHTPGPWDSTQKGDDGIVFIFNHDIGAVAMVSDDLAAQPANILLISKAPTMYQAIKNAVYEHFRYGGISSDTISEMQDIVDRLKP
jgi:hypothetical protein